MNNDACVLVSASASNFIRVVGGGEVGGGGRCGEDGNGIN